MTQIETNEILTIKNVSHIVLASGFVPEVQGQKMDELLEKHKNIVYCTPYGTVVQAASSGKSAAMLAITKKG